MFNFRKAVVFVAGAVLPIFLAGCSGASADPDPANSGSIASESSALRSFPPLPSPTLAAPKGNELAFYHDALGVQIYSCQAVATGFAFTFVAPEASLFDRRGRVVIKHFGGPTWQSVADGSSVVATVAAAFTDDPQSIAELLLKASSHTGKGIMSDVTFIQRLETVGGLAPTTGCDADHVGVTVRVPYSATYFFYRAESESDY